MNIEEYIKKNKEEFDNLEPSSNHLRNFENKLSFDLANHKRKTGFPFFKIAGVVVLIVMSSMWVIQNFIISDSKAENSFIQLSDVSPEYRDVEVYYTSGINTALNELQTLGPEGEKMKNEIYKTEFRELDSLYMNLQKELSSQPDNEMIIDAMIIHYRTKLEIIENILIQLKKAKTLTPKDHETNEI